MVIARGFVPIGLYFREVNVYIDLAEIKYIYVCVCVLLSHVQLCNSMDL